MTWSGILFSGKTLGWRFFSDFPGFCRAIGSLCTISCVGSLMTLSAMSCNRYVLICHQQYYYKIFTTRNSIIMCCCFFFVGFVLVGLNFVGLGNHSFDHKSLECIWDRMADHSYTIVFAVVMVLIPITVIGLSYIRLYMYVRQSRLKIHNHGNNSNHKSEASVSATQPPACFDELELTKSANDGTAICDLARKESNEENDEQPEVQPQESDLQRKQDFLKKLRFDASGPLTEMRLNTLQGESRSSQKSAYDFDKDDRPSQSVSVRQPNKSSKSGGGSSTSTLKLARALFIIYLVFSACWLPFSLLIVLDANDTFSHDLHVTIVAWAHLHPSINWLVYYLTHQKFYTAFRKLLGMDRCCT